MGCNSSTEVTQGTTNPKSNSIPTDIASTQLRAPLSEESHQNSQAQVLASESKPTAPVLTKKNDEVKALAANEQVTIDIVIEPEVKVTNAPEPKTESEPEPEPFIIQSPPCEESSDDGSELSRDSFEGYIVTNTPSPAIVRSEEGGSSIASSTNEKTLQPQQPIVEKKVSAPEKPITIISSKEEFIYEYERWQPFVQWGQSNPGHILPSDPGM
jgi:hypothetical protein